MKSAKSFFTFAALLLALLQCVMQAFAQPATPKKGTWITNGTVSALAYAKGLAYIGGDFTYVGPNTGYGAALSTATGVPDIQFPQVNGPIDIVTPDGADGWYIGGKFTKVGDLTRNWIAHIKADGTVDSNWDPNPSGTLKTEGMAFYASMHIYAIVVSGSTIYVGGNFTNIGGQPRHGIAALEASTGQATSWNPNASSIVRSLAVKDTTVYAGGLFDSIGGQSRQYLAAISVATGNATAWNPVLNAGVTIMASSDSLLFVGGLFSSAGGQARQHLATFDLANGQVTTWKPSIDLNIYALAIDGTTLYAGGNFNKYLAAFSIYSNTPLSWSPGANGPVQAICLYGSTIYAGGDFTKIGGQSRQRIAALNKATGNATAWNSVTTAQIRGLATNTNGSILYVGGNFVSIGGKWRNRLAALHAASGAVIAWNPNLNNSVQVITASGPNVYIGGLFTAVGGASRSHVAAIDAITGAATNWNPNANDNVYAITIDSSTVYVGGKFTAIGGQTRNLLAALDIDTGLAKSWNPNVLGYGVYNILTNGDTIYVGGDFVSVGGQSRQALAAIDANTGQATAWNPNLNASGIVYAMAGDGSTLYLGGTFDTVKGQTRNHLAAVDLTTADPTAWNPNANGAVRVLMQNGANVFATGAFTSIGAQTRNYLAAIAKTTGIATGWNPNPNNYGYSQSLLAEGSVIFVGGIFTTMGGNLQGHLAQFGTITESNTPPNAPSAMNQYKADGTTVIPEGGIAGENKVVFKVTVSDPDDEPVKLQIEVKKTTEAFNGTQLLQSNGVNSGTQVTLIRENLNVGSYKWRCRTMDARGKFSAWTEFGTPGNTDFTHAGVPVYPSADSPQLAGDEFWVKVNVGTETQPVANLFGLSFVLEFNFANYIEVVTSSIRPEPFIESGSSVVLHQRVDVALGKGKVSIGLSRTNGQSNVNGYGPVLRVKFVSFNAPAGTQVKFSISNVAAIDSLGNPIPLVTGVTNIILNPSATRTVWPGDTNNDGTVSQADILPLGLYWASPGPVRPNASMQWIGQSCPTWGTPLATYADADGNGKIDQVDIFPIGLNWGKSSTAPSLAANSGLEKTSEPTSATIAPEVIPPEQAPNQEFLMRIKVAEVSNLFGLSFELLYDQPQFLQVLMVEPDSSFGQDVVFYSNTDAANGKIAVGISRKVPQSGMSGAGSVVRVKAKLAANVTAGTKITLSLQNVKANDANGAAMSLSPQAISLTVSSTTGIDSNKETSAPTSYRLLQNHPNPFNAGTLIKYELPQAGPVSVKIYNLTGQEILEMVNAVQQPGRYQINWNGRDSRGETVPSGVYIYRLQAGSFVQTQRMIVVR
jgi:FlgD Ig-like domain/Cohesin domain